MEFQNRDFIQSVKRTREKFGAPMILLHARIDRSPSPRGRALHSLLFAAAYLTVWTLFAAVAAARSGGPCRLGRGFGGDPVAREPNARRSMSSPPRSGSASKSARYP